MRRSDLYAVGSALLVAWSFACRSAPVPPIAPGGPGVPTASWVPVYFEEFDSVAVAAGLAPLRTVALAPGMREVRIWIGGSGYPQDLYRFIDRSGQVSGELIRHWPIDGPGEDSRPGESFHDLMLYSQRGRCARFSRRADTGVCRSRFIREPDWAAVLRRADDAGLWSLPDESTLPIDSLIALDGWAITVELRNGPEYRTYHYGNPDAHLRSPEARRAVEIADAVRSIEPLLRRPDVVRRYRGITTGTYESAFRPCGSSAAWEFHGELRHLAERRRIVLPDSGPDRTRHYYVEVMGELAPDWLVRRWHSRFPRVLQVWELHTVRPVRGERCD